MMGWVIMVALAALTFLGLWRWVRRDAGAMQFLGAALLLALAGYAWQGRPGLAGVPKASQAEAPRPKSRFAQLRRQLLGETDNGNVWMTMADPYLEAGDTEQAVRVIQSGIDKAPRDMDLWLGLADALVQHADGQVTPAAQLAFQRAAQIAPNHPAPTFFFGVALAGMGQFEAADQLWQEVLANPQVTDAWRDAVAQERARIAQMRAMAGAAPPMR